MTKRPPSFLLALLAGVLAAPTFLAGCKSCERDKHVAEVRKHQGDVKRDTAKTLEKWERADDGAHLSMGDAVKTGPGSEAIVRLSRGGTLKLPSDTTIRFLASKPGAADPRLAVETGEAQLEASEGELAIETSIGLARIEPGGTLRVAAGEGGSTRFSVSIGAARIETADGGISLSPGKSVEVSLGGAIIERDPANAPVDAGKVAEVVVASVDAGAGKVAIEVHGKGVRVQASGQGAFVALAEGTSSVNGGDVVEVPSGTSIDVQRGAQRGRFAGSGRVTIGDADAAGSALARTSAGSVMLEATSEEVRVEVPGGVVAAKPAGADGKSRVAAEIAAGTKVIVRQGSGDVRGKTTESMRAGEGALLTAKGVVTSSSRGPERTDFSTRAGESIIIRDPRPPTSLGIDFSAQCPGAGVVMRQNGTGVRGDRRAALLFDAGQHPYTIHCIGPNGMDETPAASGTVTVIRDAALAELPRVPPSTLVDMDGRRYTVLYQNLLPSVNARWQGAPATKPYVLQVDGQKLKSDAPRKELKPGSIGEGTHVLHFETEDGKSRSAETTLVIKFDNAAPAVNVREPAEGSFQAGEPVKVSGVVVEGWNVAVNGQTVALDEQNRFSTTATAGAGENAIVLRLTHKIRGTVHYVRRAGGARP